MFRRAWMTFVGVVVVAAMTVMVVGSAEAKPKPVLPDLPISLPVTGTAVPLRLGDPRPPADVEGVLTGFDVRRGQLVALVSNLQIANGGGVQSAAIPITDIVSEPAATQGDISAQQVPACSILHLVLGPLDLNLLGLRVQLNQVVLDITAIPGAGNLLGNLLCAVAGLLDGGLLGPVLGFLTLLAFLNTLFPAGTPVAAPAGA